VGKTTVLRSLVLPRLRARDSSVELTGAGESHPLDGQRICLLPQSPVVPARLRVLELVQYCCHVRGVPSSEAPGLVDLFGLSSLADRRAGALSGGQKQRLNLALSFVGNPRLILLDEPTVGLDPIARSQFGEALRSPTSAPVVVLSSHVASDIAVADRVFLLTSSGISWVGSPEEFLSHSGTGQFDDAFIALSSEQQR